MPRFQGIPVDASPSGKPRFQGVPVDAPAEPSVMEDVTRSGATGVRRGLEWTAGSLGDVNAVNSNVARKVAEWFGASPETAETIGSIIKYMNPATALMPTTGQVKEHLSEPLLGDEYKPETTAGEYARTVGEFLPAAVAGPGSIGRRLMTQAVVPGLSSEAAGQATEGTSWEPYARVGGAVAGAMAPSVMSRAVTPFPGRSPERQAAVDTLRKEGVDLTAGQTTGSQRLRYRESELGGSAGQAFMERQGEQFTKAALKRAGIDAQRATPEIIDQAFTRIGNQFDDLAAKTRVPMDAKLQDDMLNSVVEYQSLSGNVAPAVERMMNRAAELAGKNGGALEGEAYKNLRSEMGRLSAKADAPTKEALRELQGAIDDAIERHMPQQFMKDWQTARRQYRNILVLEKAATGAGENAALGIISPSQLRNATVQQGRRSYARGQGDFADLARAGEAAMKALPQSGTAPRLMAQGGASAVGATIGSLLGGAPGAAIGAIGGATLPSALGKLLLSGPGRSYLNNQLLSQGTTDPRLAATIAALMAGGGQRGLPPPQ